MQIAGQGHNQAFGGVGQRLSDVPGDDAQYQHRSVRELACKKI